MNAAILQRANHLQPSAIADVAESFVGVSAKCTLQNVAAAGAIEQRTPLFQLTYTIRRLPRVNLGHAPAVQKLSAAHRVAKVRAPVVSRIDVSHRGGNTTFSHYRVGLRSEERRVGKECRSR